MKESPPMIPALGQRLACHPGTCSDAVRGIEARVGWADGDALEVVYILEGNLNRIRIPPPAQPVRTDELWRHTCFEAFIASDDEPPYYEFNFSPSGRWAIYHFRKYRDPGEDLDVKAAPKITAQSDHDRYRLGAVAGLDDLPVLRRAALIKLALCAVIEDEGGILTYWALKHPSGKPDFHHRDGFALEIERPDGE